MYMSESKLPEVAPLPEVENEDTHWDFLHPDLLKPPFVWYIVAPMGAGKTTIINHLVYRLYSFPQGYKTTRENEDGEFVETDVSGECGFDSVIFMSTTAGNDNNARFLLADPKVTFIEIPRTTTKDKKKVKHEDMVDDILCKIYDNQFSLVAEAREAGRREPHLLLILDDMLGLIRDHSRFVADCSRLRQPRITVILTSQMYKRMPNLIRMNAWCLSIFRLTEKSGTQIAEEWADFCKKKEFFKAMKICKTGEDGKTNKHAFMTIDRSRTKMWRNAFVEEIPVEMDDDPIPEELHEHSTEPDKTEETPAEAPVEDKPEPKPEIKKPVIAKKPVSAPKCDTYIPPPPKKRSSSSSARAQCSGQTKKGSRCKNKSNPKYGQYCYAHRNYRG